MRLLARIMYTFFERASCGGLQADRIEEGVEVVREPLVETIELVSFFFGESSISRNRAEQAGGQRGIHALEPFQEDQRDPIALRAQTVPTGVRETFNESLRAQLREVIAKGGEAVLFGWQVECGGRAGVQVLRRKRITGRDVGDADECVHQGQLSRVIELESGNASAAGEPSGFGQLAELAAVDEGFKDVLLDGEIAIDDSGHRGAQLRHRGDGFGDPDVEHVVGGGFGPQEEMIAHVLFDRSVAVVAADDGIEQVEILDEGLEFPAIAFGHLAGEDGRELGGLADGPGGIKQPVTERI
jgi:hypothetical protein